MNIHPVFAAGASAEDAGYSPAILAEGRKMLFISGQVPNNVKANPETQIREAFVKIEKLLQTAGGSFANVVMMRYYLVNMERDLPIMRKVRRDFLTDPCPASTCLGVTALAIPGLEIEVEAVAVL